MLPKSGKVQAGSFYDLAGSPVTRIVCRRAFWPNEADGFPGPIGASGTPQVAGSG